MMQTLIHLIADGTLLPIALLGIYALVYKVPHGHRYEAYCRILMAGLTAFLLAKLLATFYQPETLRPFELKGIAPGAAYLPNPGFPSDHALFATAITLAVWFETKHRKITAILVALTLLVSVGRVLALVHTPLDVIGGILIACLGSAWYFTAPPTKLRKSKHTK
jgi:membrane-associated phospholipid phosphatase